MSPETVFLIQLVLGYVVWLLCFSAYALPKLRSMDRVEAHRAMATLHSFRFFGLVFILPGVIGPGLPAGFGTSAAYGDFANARFSGCSWAPSISWERPTSSPTITTPSS
jgi:hypothetical protein